MSVAQSLPNAVAGHAEPARAPDAGLRALLDGHYAFIWRQLRRLGLPDDRAEDAAQRVFFIASKRLGDVKPGSERSFLFGIARRVAADARRSATARRETPAAEVPEMVDTALRADELIDRQRACARLEEVLGAMDDDLREVFVLFELEELTLAEIAEMIPLPLGTATSRLRRARAAFQDAVKRLSARARPRRGAS